MRQRSASTAPPVPSGPAKPRPSGGLGFARDQEEAGDGNMGAAEGAKEGEGRAHVGETSW